MSIDVRWKQRLQNYHSALSQLQSAVRLSHSRVLTELEKQGLIQAFEFTHELAWNLIKDYLEYQGLTGITGSRDAAREAFSKKLVTKGEVWMEMIKSRNQTSHTYNHQTAEEIVNLVIKDYLGAFEELENKMLSFSK